MKKLEKRLATLRHDIQGSKKCNKDRTKDLLIYIFKKHKQALNDLNKRKRLIKQLKSNAAVITRQSYKAYGSGDDCECGSDEGVIGTQCEADSEAELIGEGESSWPCEMPMGDRHPLWW